MDIRKKNKKTVTPASYFKEQEKSRNNPGKETDTLGQHLRRRPKGKKRSVCNFVWGTIALSKQVAMMDGERKSPNGVLIGRVWWWWGGGGRRSPRTVRQLLKGRGGNRFSTGVGVAGWNNKQGGKCGLEKKVKRDLRLQWGLTQVRKKSLPSGRHMKETEPFAGWTGKTIHVSNNNR